MFDGKAFGQEVVTAVHGFLEKNVAPLLSRIDALEKRFAELPTPKDGNPGKDADPEAVALIVAAGVRKDIDAIRSVVEALPAPIEILKAPELPNIPAMVAEAIAAIPAPQNGKDADPEQVAQLVREEAERILAGWERPQDGKDGAPGLNGEKGLDGTPGKDGEDGKPGRDGVGLAGAVIDWTGNLVLTLTDGTTRDLGLIIGKDGSPGKDGESGRDGFGFDDLDVVETEKGWMIRFKRADQVKEFRLPIPVDRGVFKDGQSYIRGDGVSFGGSWFIAQEDTADKPETSKAWRLAVKRGRDGKDGEMKPPRDPKPVKVG